jgi:hypothetical protein
VSRADVSSVVRCRRSVRPAGLTCARFSAPSLTRKDATQLWSSVVRVGSCHVRPMCAQGAIQGLGIVLARLVSDARVSCLSEGRMILASGIICASMPVTGWDRRVCPLHHLPLLLAGVLLVNADSVQQPLLHPTALQQVLPKERVVGHQRLRRCARFGLEGDQPS